MNAYNPLNCYWIGQPAGQSATLIYSSAKGAAVQPNDATYEAWLAAGNVALPWPKDDTGALTTAALDALLAHYDLPATGLTAPTAAGLAAYANAKQWALATGGYTITIGAAALVWATDATSQALITGKALRLQQAGAPTSTNWQFASGFVTVAAADFIAAAAQIADFVQSTFDALAPVLAAIAAGSTTTTAAIDEATWPSNVSSTPA